VILTDTGPIVALLDADDPNYTSCVAAAQRLSAEPLITTWPCITEAMYLLGSIGGYRYQSTLWRLWETKRLILHDLTAPELERMSALMKKYRDMPMDLADASLIVVAESRTFRQIFTLDQDFYIYRYRLADENRFASKAMA
jgi:predicted nucleic acid-binding protein